MSPRLKEHVLKAAGGSEAIVSTNFGRFKVRSDGKIVRISLPPATVILPPWGPRLWSEFHQKALDLTFSDFLIWLPSFNHKIPCGKCRIHWAKILTENPPAEPLSTWSIARHNDVNLLLNKPIYAP